MIYTLAYSEQYNLLGGEIDDYVANIVIAQLLFLQSEDPKKDVSLYVNSPTVAHR